ncbi:MAG TPA: acylphosphatase [Burkholderiales bacterium]|nr:acylphosphatase [Burkholderiales bacterium]
MTIVKTAHLRIRGRVQGVGFRFFVQREARERALSGWVRNRRDGSVEAVIQGPVEAVDALVEAVRRGPPSARVTDVQVSAAEGSFGGFELRATE